MVEYFSTNSSFQKSFYDTEYCFKHLCWMVVIKNTLQQRTKIFTVWN